MTSPRTTEAELVHGKHNRFSPSYAVTATSVVELETQIGRYRGRRNLTNSQARPHRPFLVVARRRSQVTSLPATAVTRTARTLARTAVLCGHFIRSFGLFIGYELPPVCLSVGLRELFLCIVSNSSESINESFFATRMRLAPCDDGKWIAFDEIAVQRSADQNLRPRRPRPRMPNRQPQRAVKSDQSSMA